MLLRAAGDERDRWAVGVSENENGLVNFLFVNQQLNRVGGLLVVVYIRRCSPTPTD